MAESNSKQDAVGAEDENKRKFREALERKMTKTSGVSEHKDGGGKQSRAHGAAGGGRREFRRKSG
ncbi:DUF5302 domain-containing protein [Mycobacterium sherrisii]|uniref:DUF5302 domain-containing protein n=1 Tax=Mycobacterium sherrisii TaxID=243061 RepID=A0A1E3SRJ4_9MYCO|nr:DUF5302 domain-containing protein [Mycobacterium sherrisii]MCV7030485.1 DUF5302 domain-containing protein [Mycobacterium sherrisii]MEC4762229.1 DUF5302 domain-containing protein [Mycobacterium sherrisii]ODR04766.1 hypothetical protein BHQ21_16420 [Mycobacterium sherrisii]ORW81401.1 hypothetical protein AWC25_03205 [Mycobacterium sherrisii]